MKRSSSLRRTDSLSRTQGLRPVSNRRRRRDRDYGRQRLAAFDRARGRCEAGTPACTGQAEQVHHVAGRGGPDPHRLENLLICCDSCHRRIHDRPAESYRNGWMALRNGGAA